MATFGKIHQIGILGLGVIGRSIALNLHRHGTPVCGYDPANTNTADFPFPLATSLEELTCMLMKPRVILLMVPAGKSTETAILSIRPYLQKNDIIIDGGNSYFLDTEQRSKILALDGIHLIGMGISGGELGALWGPSLMVGGVDSAWEYIKEIFQSIAARTPDGLPCMAWMGNGGAGHYVKMVHNGIEYANMQLIAEIYDLLHRGIGLSNQELSEIFTGWNAGVLKSYLIEITATILRRMDGESSLIDLILDVADQKGTGKWASQNSFDVGTPAPTITTAAESRLLSNLKSERICIGSHPNHSSLTINKADLIAKAQQALYASVIISFTQGFAMLRSASSQYDWNLGYKTIAEIWRAGSIIRADLLENIAAAFEKDSEIPNLQMDEFINDELLTHHLAWREVVKTAIDLGIPTLALSTSLGYYDAYHSVVLPANLIQAQRDYFGAHTYHRVDKDGVFHTQWEQSPP